MTTKILISAQNWFKMYLLRSNRSKCNVNIGRYCCMEFNMGLFILRWRTLGRSDDLSVHIYNLLFYLDHVYIVTGETRLAGLPGLLWRVTLSKAFPNFSRCSNPPSQGCVHVTFASALTTSPWPQCVLALRVPKCCK